jgi:hypothetical protein
MPGECVMPSQRFVLLVVFALATPMACAARARPAPPTDVPSIEQVATNLAADYQQAQVERLSRQGKRDDLIAAALLASSPGAARVRGIDDSGADGAIARLAAAYPRDALALYTAALLCNAQQAPCAHPEYRERLLARDPANAIHHLLVPSGAPLSPADLHTAARATFADTHFSALLGIVRHALAEQGPRNPPEAWRGNVELTRLLRRNEIGRVPWPNYGPLMTTCNVDAARSADAADTRRDCAGVGARLFAERGNNIATRMVGSTLLRRFAKGTAQADAAVQLRRQYVWLSEQMPDDLVPAEKERRNAEEVALGEWEAYQRSAARSGVAPVPPADWVPQRPEQLLLQEDRPPKPATVSPTP